MKKLLFILLLTTASCGDDKSEPILEPGFYNMTITIVHDTWPSFWNSLGQTFYQTWQFHHSGGVYTITVPNMDAMYENGFERGKQVVFEIDEVVDETCGAMSTFHLSFTPTKDGLKGKGESSFQGSCNPDSALFQIFEQDADITGEKQ